MPTCVEDVELSLRRARARTPRRRRERALAVLARYGLAEHADVSVHALSGGQKQLLALAGVLATEPAVLVADEPTTLLDLRQHPARRRPAPRPRAAAACWSPTTSTSPRAATGCSWCEDARVRSTAPRTRRSPHYVASVTGVSQPVLLGVYQPGDIAAAPAAGRGEAGRAGGAQPGHRAGAQHVRLAGLPRRRRCCSRSSAGSRCARWLRAARGVLLVAAVVAGASSGGGTAAPRRWRRCSTCSRWRWPRWCSAPPRRSTRCSTPSSGGSLPCAASAWTPSGWRSPSRSRSGAARAPSTLAVETRDAARARGLTLPARLPLALRGPGGRARPRDRGRAHARGIGDD